MLLCLAAGCSSASTGATARGNRTDPRQAISVYSRARNGYVRSSNPDGSLKPETYVLRAGTRSKLSESRTSDELSLDDISRAIAGPLAVRGYVPGGDPDTTRLLLLAYWGTTLIPDDVHPIEGRASTQEGHIEDYWGKMGVGPPSPEGFSPDSTQWTQLPKVPVYQKTELIQDSVTDSTNAAILGYADAILGRQPVDRPAETLINELEQHRYYVVLLAYDYQRARTQGQRTLLWETRFSLTEAHNDFGKSLAAMALVASGYFGQDSHGLIHNELKEGHVEVGEPKALDTVP